MNRIISIISDQSIVIVLYITAIIQTSKRRKSQLRSTYVTMLQIKRAKTYLLFTTTVPKHVKSSKKNKNTVQIYTLYKLKITANSKKYTRAEWWHFYRAAWNADCLLYTSDAADE